MLERGNVHARGDKVEPAFPGILAREPAGAAAGCRQMPPPCGRRLALARWIASPDESADGPGDGQSRLAASFRPRDRPFAEQFWRAGHPADASRTARLAGRPAGRGGLAAQTAAPPDHAVERLSNVVAASIRGQRRVDPINDLFSHFDMRRLSAEELRDSILAVAGQLNPQMYGPGVYPEISAEVLAGQSRARRRLGQIDARAAGAAEHLHPRQAFADHAAA